MMRQQPKDFYAVGLDALLKCILLVDDMSRNKCLFHVGVSHILRFIPIYELFTDYPLYVSRLII
jgi:hypothetical protein